MRTCLTELAPTGKEHRDRPPMRLRGMLVEEERTPEGVNLIRRILPTTPAADTLKACRRVVEYYAQR